MVLFWPIQQELDCINSTGDILGKINYDPTNQQFRFVPDHPAVKLSSTEQQMIADKLFALHTGQSSIALQDDD